MRILGGNRLPRTAKKDWVTMRSNTMLVGIINMLSRSLLSCLCVRIFPCTLKIGSILEGYINPTELECILSDGNYEDQGNAYNLNRKMLTYHH